MKARKASWHRLWLLMLVGTLSTAGCAPKVVPTTGPRPPTDPASIAILQDPPGKYEVLGIVRTDNSFEWDEIGEMQKTIDELKQKAAALGANGLLLEVPEYRLKAVGTYNEVPYNVPVDRAKTRNAMATAIWVHK